MRRFHQDDAHIFCTPDQVAGEIASCLGFVKHVYQERFGFQPKYRLSTRPSKSAGSDELWAKAEAALKSSLDANVESWSLNAGDGAFYGPKIDLSIDDAMGRAHQVGTIQLDFQMPDRFDLKFQDTAGALHRPVMIHRAILGRFEYIFFIASYYVQNKLELKTDFVA